MKGGQCGVEIRRILWQRAWQYRGNLESRWIGEESSLFDNESVRLRVELHLTVCQDKGEEKFPPDPQTGFIVARLEED